LESLFTIPWNDGSRSSGICIQTTYLLKEYLGLLVYRLRGWAE
jgi:hypothetical protein